MSIFIDISDEEVIKTFRKPVKPKPVEVMVLSAEAPAHDMETGGLVQGYASCGTPPDDYEPYRGQYESDEGSYDLDRVQSCDTANKPLPETDYISRNGYGALIYNTKNILIADVDISYLQEDSHLKYKDNYIKYFKGLESSRKEGLILYETHSGFRVVMVDRIADPTSEYSRELLGLLLSDKVYSACCETQKCYRARLTPKPFRVGLRGLDKILIFMDTKSTWISNYEYHSKQFGVCKFITGINEYKKIDYRVLNFMLVHKIYTQNRNVNGKLA